MSAGMIGHVESFQLVIGSRKGSDGETDSSLWMVSYLHHIGQFKFIDKVDELFPCNSLHVHP